MRRLTLIELDTLRADTMRAMLNDEGRGYVWQYDICRLREALREAAERQNYDDLQIDSDGLRAGQQYALIGPGICDHPFTTPAELVALLQWLCVDGYLGCYQAARWHWQPHLASDQAAVVALWA